MNYLSLIVFFNKRTIIIRHDVDFDLSKALEMAKFENANNVISTYYLLISSDFL